MQSLFYCLENKSDEETYSKRLLRRRNDGTATEPGVQQTLKDASVITFHVRAGEVAGDGGSSEGTIF